jgi:hypothetical protein
MDGEWTVMHRHDGGKAQVFRITGARTALAEDVRGRQRRYVMAMVVRTLAVVLAIVLWDVAVVIANAGREQPPSLPATIVVTPWDAVVPAALPAGTSAGPASRDASAFREGRDPGHAPQ